ncbi:MAG: hypothetical protein D4S01_05725 [Dehalococcoidia bacterium]|nr:MAG: hypothetical protein D4S01_05725 [Dehalococcoidia bacterium]
MEFSNPEQKKGSIIEALKALKDNTGWKVIVKALKLNINQAEARLHGDIKLEAGETIEYWQKIRNDRMKMLELPGDLIKENEERETFPPELDPYE